MTTLQSLLGIEHPLIQAPMAGVQLSALAIAVSNAGGLGSLPCAMLAPEGMRKELEALKAGIRRPLPPARAERRSAPRRPSFSPNSSRRW